MIHTALREIGVSETKSINREKLFKEQKLEADRIMLINLEKDINQKWEMLSKLEKDLNILRMNQEIVQNFIASFLSITREFTIEKLKFYQNAMRYIVLTDVNLPNSFIDKSVFSYSTILNTKFDGSIITGTGFTGSNLSKSSFVGCNLESSLFDNTTLKDVDFSESQFNDVFFIGSNLNGAKFIGTKGLNPLYFYKAKNVNKAKFDDTFKKELDETNITEDKFKEYITKHSILSNQRKKELFTILDRPKKNKKKIKPPIIK